MKELLIVRSVSFQQLDLNLPKIRSKFPNYNLNILTHAHGVKLAEKYDDINQIYIYDYKESFNFKHKSKSLKDKKFDILIIPVSNITGAGFANVFSFALTIKSKKKYMCNLVSDIKYISNLNIITKVIINFIYKGLAYILTFILALLLIPILIINIIFKKEGKI